jgi:hypothetical protein
MIMNTHPWKRWTAAALVGGSTLTLAAFGPLRAQEAPKAAQEPKAEAKQEAPASTDPIARIRKEGLENSKVMETLSYLTDVIGPRLTNSPGMKRANEWTRDTLTKWGLENAKLEPWGPFGRGWELKSFSLQVVEPQCIPIIAFPKAWSPGVPGGRLVAPLVYVDAEKVEDLDKYKGKLKGAIVLVGDVRVPAARFEPLGTRYTDSELLEMANALPPAERAPGQGRRPGGPAAGGPGAAPGGQPDMAALRARFEVARRREAFLRDEAPAVILSPSTRGDGGTLFVQSASIIAPGAAPAAGPGGPGGGANRPRVWSKETKENTPQITVAVEHFNRLARMIKQGEQLKAEVVLDVKFQDEDEMGYNTVAEIVGSDPTLKEEVVMLGGHLDSWHSATCATDNAAGVAVGMEAVRLIKALDLKPKRTIRIALWSGEEQGLLGSRAYVTEHFAKRGEGGKLETTPEYDKFSAYYNLDNGTGKIRGIYLQGNEAVRPHFRKWLAPFHDLGAATITINNTGGTDHQSFDGVGLPGFQFIQDEVEYDTRTHHSNMDEYDRAQPDDLKQASVIMAAFVYQTAMLDERLPRKPAPGTTPTESRPAGAVGGAAGGSGR